MNPPEGRLPPREVAVGMVVRDDAKTKPEEKLMRLRLGEDSGAIRVPRPEQVVTLRDQENDKLWWKQGLAAPPATGNLRLCLSITAEADPGNRRQWFVFRADRADARTPI